jgi:hypothetical protein
LAKKIPAPGGDACSLGFGVNHKLLIISNLHSQAQTGPGHGNTTAGFVSAELLFGQRFYGIGPKVASGTY